MKLFTVVLVLFTLSSCATKNWKHKYIAINPSLNSIVDNMSTGQNGQNFLSLFGIDQSAKEVKIYFDNQGDLRVAYKDPNLNIERFKSFKGKFKRGYFEIYFEKKRVVIPPFYWTTQINRLRIGVEKDSTLIVERYSNHSGMILLMAGGSSSKIYYRYAALNSKNLNL